MTLRQTHTYAVLDVPPTVYAAVRALLRRAEYSHAIHQQPDGEVIDLHGLALRAAGGDPGSRLTVGTLLSARSKEGRVELALDGALCQMDLDKAREVVGMLQGAIEAALTDQMLYHFLVTRVGLSDDDAGRALLDFRELRQGSRDTVHPS